MIATIEALLHNSNQNSRLGNVTDDAYLHYLWTVIPATIMSLLGLYLGSLDNSTCSLAPYSATYSAMKTAAPFSRSIGLSLLDISIPRALVREVQVRAYAEFAATLACFVVWLSAIFAGSLLSKDAVTLTYPTQLLAISSLPSSTEVQSRLNTLDMGPLPPLFWLATGIHLVNVTTAMDPALGPFFAILAGSPYTPPLDWLGDPTRMQDVGNALECRRCIYGIEGSGPSAWAGRR
ncbi:hypothetical protein GQ53DRAFT_815003 [Thozetella sp. PMI_491]|nr:hypothetical protein GQ53DRAFT_815003 [Thozetella sp. PMI_491]